MISTPTFSPPSRRLTIAIDGPAGAGKSTVAREVARALGYTYIDTGAMYRAVAWAVLEHGISPGDESAVTALAEQLHIGLQPGYSIDNPTRVFADSDEITDLIRTPSISNLTSPLSAIPGVRRRLVALQQAMGAKGGVVMEGRDIGTVVLPNADIKVFLTASLERRAERRQAEMAERGTPVSYESLLADIAARDTRDRSRELSPLKAAPGAVILDSDHSTAQDVVQHILALCNEAPPSHV